jgi:hypothetical protein
MNPIQCVIAMLILSFLFVVVSGYLYEFWELTALSYKFVLFWLIAWCIYGFIAATHSFVTYKPAGLKQSYIKASP